MNEQKSATYAILEELLRKMQGKSKLPKTTLKAAPLENPYPSRSKRLISEKDIKILKEYDEIIFHKGDIITPLAKDLIKKKHIRIIQD